MKAGRGEKVGGAAALMVFCIFAMLVFSVLMLGAGAYVNIADTSRDGFDESICLSYVWTKVKSSDGAGSVYVDGFHGTAALFIEETHGGTLFNTIIHYHDGWVYELFAETGLDFPPGSGARVMKVQSLLFEQMEGGNIKASVGDMNVFISLRGDNGLERSVQA